MEYRFFAFLFVVCLVFLSVFALGLVLLVVETVRRQRAKKWGATTVIHSCPSQSRWRDWLDNRLTGDERADMAVHLEGCLQCQRTLDELAGADRAWADMAREAFTAAPPEPGFARALSDWADKAGEALMAAPLEAGFARAMNDLKDRPPVHTMDAPQSFQQPSADPAQLAKLNGYEILSEVGRGGMGVVLKAFDPKLRRVVAIKVLAPHLAASGPARERFLREARAAAAVVHEHVVTIHAIEETANPPYIVMQFVAGRSLEERLDKEGPLQVKEILRIGMQAASGLAAAHAQGLVHRDIKPANILLENGVERVKLVDFGLARASDDASLTHSGVVTGSPMYMSPEQARGETADSRSDLFGLGCVLYAMCAGHSPFRAPTALAVLKRVCDDAPRPPHEVNPEIPDWLEAIVLKLLAKDPADRFGSAGEVADILGRHLRHLQEPDAPAPPPVVVPVSAFTAQSDRPRPAATAKESNRAVWIVLACVLGLFLFCAGLPAAFILFRLFAQPSLGPVQYEKGGGIDGESRAVKGPPQTANGMMSRQTPTRLIDKLDDAAFKTIVDFDYLGPDASKLQTLSFRFRTKRNMDAKALDAAITKLQQSYQVRLTTALPGHAAPNGTDRLLPIRFISRPEDTRYMVELIASTGDVNLNEIVGIKVEETKK